MFRRFIQVVECESACVCVYYIPFYGWIVFHFIAIRHLFIYSSVNGHLGCFYVSDIMNNAAMNTVYKFLCEFMVFILLGTVQLRVLQKNTTSRQAYLQRDVCVKELAHMIMVAGKPQICMVDWQAGDSHKSWYCSSPRLENQRTTSVAVRVWGLSASIIPCCLRDISLFSVKAFNNEVHPQYEALLKAHRYKC